MMSYRRPIDVETTSCVYWVNAKIAKLTMNFFYSCPDFKEIKKGYFRMSEMNKKIIRSLTSDIYNFATPPVGSMNKFFSNIIFDTLHTLFSLHMTFLDSSTSLSLQTGFSAGLGRVPFGWLLMTEASLVFFRHVLRFWYAKMYI